MVDYLDTNDDDAGDDNGANDFLADFAYGSSPNSAENTLPADSADGDGAAAARSSGSHGNADELGEFTPSPVPEGVYERLQSVAEERGGASELPGEYDGSVARSMFDTPQSKDNSLTLVMPKGHIDRLPTQSLVRIKSRDGRDYLGAVVAGPFAEPDGLRADSPIVVTVTVSDSLFMPPYHGRVQVEILGEETKYGLAPPRFRPLPNSPVLPLDLEETARVLKIDPPDEDMPVPIGLAVGYENLSVALPGRKMGVLPRHVGILGTTGGGKSTTVSGFIDSLQKIGYAVILIDTEGEYTHIDKPTDRLEMLSLLHERGLTEHGVKHTVIYRLVGKATTNPSHERVRSFSLPFENLSPHQVAEVLEMTEAQSPRFLDAYEIARRMLDKLGIFPAQATRAEDEKLLQAYDELERGFPRMTLNQIIDVVELCALAARGKMDDVELRAHGFPNAEKKDVLTAFQAVKPGSLQGDHRSWFALSARLWRLRRLGIFDIYQQPNGERVAPINFSHLTKPGVVSIFDLSGTDSPQINNLVIAELLRGIHEQQDANFKLYEQAQERGETPEPHRAMIVIEEAHEFLSSERIKQMPVLREQVERIARRGRKRWLGLTFVTQLPQHLPNEVLGLLNNFILHKISDDGVISRLRKILGGIDDSLWNRLPGLAAGQAVLTAPSLARPLLVSVNPTPCKLRMTE